MDNSHNIILLSIAGTSVMLFLVLVIVLFVINYGKRMNEKDAKHKIAMQDKELEMLRAVINSQEEQREKIGKNLHDEVGPLLSTVKLHLSTFKRKLKREELYEEDLDEEKVFLDDIIQNVRTVSHELTPHFLLKFGLVKAIKNFTSSIAAPVFSVGDDFNEKKLNKPQLINLYRVVLEVLNNIIKHDNAREASISFDLTDTHLKTIIQHNGNGITNEEFDQFASESTGLGLQNLQSRIILLKGEIHFLRDTPYTGVEIFIPLENE